jgi:hypothetical protein
MKQEVSPGVLIGAAVVVVAVLGFFIYRGVAGEVSSAPSDMGARLMKVMERTGGDVSKMNAEEKKVYEEAVKSGYYRPGGASGMMSSSGQPTAPGYGGSPPGMSGTSGSYPGSSGGTSGYSGTSGGPR